MMNRKNIALTLVEMQIAAVVVALIIIAAMSSYVFYWQSFATGNIFLDVYSNSRIAMGWMSKDIRWAAQVLPTSTLSSTVYNTSDNCIVLNVPSINNPGGEIAIIPAQFDEIIYQVQGDDLHRIVSPFKTGSTPSIRSAEDRIVATHCNPLTFKSQTATSGGIQPLSYFVNLLELDTINAVYVSLPLNERTLFSSNAADASLRPTTVIKLRNKQ